MPLERSFLDSSLSDKGFFSFSIKFFKINKAVFCEIFFVLVVFKEYEKKDGDLLSKKHYIYLYLSK